MVAHICNLSIWKVRQNCHAFDAMLDYIVSFRTAWALEWDPVSKTKSKCKQQQRNQSWLGNKKKPRKVYLTVIWLIKTSRLVRFPVRGKYSHYRQKQANVWIQGQHCLQSQFQHHTEKPCLEKNKHNNSKNKKKFVQPFPRTGEMMAQWVSRFTALVEDTFGSQHHSPVCTFCYSGLVVTLWPPWTPKCMCCS